MHQNLSCSQNLRHCADINYISFVLVMQRASENVFLDHLGERIVQSFSRSHQAMVGAICF